MPLTGKTQSGLLRGVTIGGPIMTAAPSGFLLDDYPNALVAYSFRKLRNAYAGSAVRIRRSSDSTELDVGFSGDDFDAGAAATFIGGGTGFVVTWYDQSGNAENVTNATAAEQPTYHAASFNSLPTMEFQTVGGLNNAAVATGGSNVLAVYAVALASGNANGGRLVSLYGNSATGNDWDNPYSITLEQDATTATVKGGCDFFAGGTGPSKAITFDQEHRMAVIFSGTANETYVDGVGTGTPTSYSSLDLGGATGDNCVLAIGRGAGAGVAGITWQQGYASEIVLYLDNGANRVGIDTNQAAYWGF